MDDEARTSLSQDERNAQLERDRQDDEMKDAIAEDTRAVLPSKIAEESKKQIIEKLKYYSTKCRQMADGSFKSMQYWVDQAEEYELELKLLTEKK